LEDLEHGLCITTPGLLLVAQLAPPGGRQLVETRPAIVLGKAPAGLHASRALEAMERLVERRVLDFDDAVRALANPARHRVAVHLTPHERAQHEHVEGTLQQIEGFRGHRYSPYLVRGV